MKKQILTAEIIENIQIAPAIKKITLRSPEAAASARPGQFINVYPDADRLILPRPFGLHDASAEEGTVSLIYEIVGEGTEEFAAKKAGDTMVISQPMGNGFDMDAILQTGSGTPHAVLIGGGVGVSVMQFLARELCGRGISVTSVMGFRQHPFAVEEMKSTGAEVLVTTDKYNPEAFMGNVCFCMDYHGVKGDMYFACGPHPMLKAVDEFVAARGGDDKLQVSLDGRMACGYGVCLGCSIPVRTVNEKGFMVPGRKRVCKDGPVFRGNEVIW